MSKQIVSGDFTYVFGDNGLPSGLLLPEELSGHNLLGAGASLTVTAGNGAVYHACGTPLTRCVERNAGAAKVVEFQRIGLADERGRQVPGFRLSLKHEIFADGTVFTDAFFMTDETVKPIPLKGFKLSYPLSLDTYDTVRWELAYRPKEVDGAIIQAEPQEREMLPGEERVVEHGILPLVGFNFWEKEGPSGYVELFMEGDNVLAGRADGNRSSVTWEGGNPVVSWEFLTTEEVPVVGPWQWRNRWGWAVTAAPRKRHLPPLAMYHYMDNFQHYPSNESLEAMAATGIDVLILHENWRVDIQNGGEPQNPERFQEVVDFAHAHGLRVMVYMRGNEPSVIEEGGDWFQQLLKRNYDGFYMDYGDPFNYVLPADETYQGGRILLRRHYIKNVQRRQIVGPKGVLFGHTGPLFSCLGMTYGGLDGYVSGEGERGVMVRSRLDHAFFSMASVCPGTMWTAAFPEYNEAVMVPYLAATGQSPHVPLGEQFATSSLSHPEGPGLTDKHVRPLWRLWQLMKGTEDLTVFCDYNCKDVFKADERIGHYLMAVDGQVVCIFSNFTDTDIEVDPSIDFARTGLKVAGLKSHLCLPTEATPGKAMPFDGQTFTLGAYGVGAVCFGQFDFDAFERPYPTLPECSKRRLEKAEEQRQLRLGKGTAEDWLLKVSVPDLPFDYELSMTLDLYDNRFELSELKDGTYERLGFVGRNGFQKEPTAKEDFVVNGMSSPWMSMRDILGAGHHELAIRSLHRGDLYYKDMPFYSFIHVDVARQADKPDYRLIFMNELEPDRSYLRFTLEIN